MLYGDDKAREMARSLLPSKHRHSARQSRALLNRGIRRTVRSRVARLANDVDAADDCPDLDRDSMRELWNVVELRRSGDKVNPFRRWARAVTRDLPPDERLAQVRELLPPGVIGNHALFHLHLDKHFETTAERERRAAWWSRSRHAPSHKRYVPPLAPGLLAQLLRSLLQLPDGQRAFNDHLKHACARHWFYTRGHDGRRHIVWQGLGPPRLLMGVHDVLPFLDTVLRLQHDAPRKDVTPALTESARAAEQFLRVFHQQRGDLAATLALLPQRLRPILPPPSKRKGPGKP